MLVPLDFEAKMTSSHNGTRPRDLLQGLFPSCVPTLRAGGAPAGIKTPSKSYNPGQNSWDIKAINP